VQEEISSFLQAVVETMAVSNWQVQSARNEIWLTWGAPKQSPLIHSALNDSIMADQPYYIINMWGVTCSISHPAISVIRPAPPKIATRPPNNLNGSTTTRSKEPARRQDSSLAASYPEESDFKYPQSS
jgi:hypothetical protein